MPDYITLMGAEQVQSAGRHMQSAADQMSRAAGSFDDTFSRHRLFMEEWMARFESAVARLAALKGDGT